MEEATSFYDARFSSQDCFWQIISLLSGVTIPSQLYHFFSSKQIVLQEVQSFCVGF